MIPSWVKHAVFYQIFPDRFAKADQSESHNGIRFLEWGTSPKLQGFQGGDLRGIVSKLDYLQSFGVNALYLNPIFSSAANHRYHTFDYMTVDPLLGGNDAFKDLLDACHERNIKVILDGVFNHASRGFWAFHHILENGEESPYWDWFFVQGEPLRPYNSSQEEPHNYEAWWGLPALPKFNTDNPGVRKYLLEVAAYWVKFGIDGWRLDVPQEIDDAEFWQEFRRVVKAENPEAYLCGEIWTEAPEWLSGDRFDSVMNYPFMGAALSFFGRHSLRTDYHRDHLDLQPIDAKECVRRIESYRAAYNEEVNFALLNLVDSHDTARARWVMGENLGAMKLLALFQMTMPGTPCIYYGDEIGMSSGDDPMCREAFPWHNEEIWSKDLLEIYRSASALRREHSCLRQGELRFVDVEEGFLSLLRIDEHESCLVVFNVSEEPCKDEVDRQKWDELWSNSNGEAHFSAMSAKVFLKK